MFYENSSDPSYSLKAGISQQTVTLQISPNKCNICRKTFKCMYCKLSSKNTFL